MTTGSAELQHISASEAIERIRESAQSSDPTTKPTTVLIDVREQSEWDAGHAAQAHHLPMSELEQRHPELDSQATLMIICHSGQRSLSVTEALSRAGYDVMNVDGGMIAWGAAGGAIVTDGPAQPHV